MTLTLDSHRRERMPVSLMDRARARRHRAALSELLANDPEGFAAVLWTLASQLALLRRLGELRRQGRPSTNRAVLTWMQRPLAAVQSGLTRERMRVLRAAWEAGSGRSVNPQRSLIALAETLLNQRADALRAFILKQKGGSAGVSQRNGFRQGRQPDMSVTDARKWQAAILGAKVRLLVRKSGPDDPARRTEVLRKLRREAVAMGVRPETILDRKVSHAEVFGLAHIQALLPGNAQALSRRLRRARQVSSVELPPF